jgi:hypothetical protein
MNWGDMFGTDPAPAAEATPRAADDLIPLSHLALDLPQAIRFQEAVEADSKRRASIWERLPADQLPVGVAASTALLAAAKDAQPRRLTPLEESLAGRSMTFHPFPAAEDES